MPAIRASAAFSAVRRDRRWLNQSVQPSDIWRYQPPMRIVYMVHMKIV